MTQLWHQFEEIKEVFMEPKKSSDLGPVMNSFYKCIHASEYMDAPNGALLFAIMRGKISEGFDFADNAARAVITVSSRMSKISLFVNNRKVLVSYHY